jgi:microsomal dipeptidase-like Zn-dependent dipeptidase
MHLLAQDPKVLADLPVRVALKPTNLTLEYVVRVRKQPGVWPKIRAFALLIAAKLFGNSSFDTDWRVDLDKLAQGGVRVVFSVLYLPWTEISDPDRDGDFQQLTDHLEAVSEQLDPDKAVVVKSEEDLDLALADKRVAIVHCVEGGLHLGLHGDLIDDRVRELADRGVAYITLAHLFYRGVATNAPALPKLTDGVYNAIFCQPKGEKGALSPIGELAVRAMYKHSVLIDVSHMRADALAETFALLRTLDEENHHADPKDFPVIATHAGYRFTDGGSSALSYMLDDDTIGEIAARDGVVGLIMAEHQLNHNLPAHARGEEGTFERICSHVDAIRSAAGGEHNLHVGIGSDFDGFIKPTVEGIESAADLKKIRKPLVEAYGTDADAILGGNAGRVLRKILRRRAATV